MAELATVYVVDDEGCVRAALGRLLASAGFDVRTFSALDELELNTYARPPACILIAVYGSKASEEAVAGLHARSPASKIILITGCVFEPPSWCQAWQVLRKPIDEEELLAAVRSHGG